MATEHCINWLIVLPHSDLRAHVAFALHAHADVHVKCDGSLSSAHARDYTTHVQVCERCMSKFLAALAQGLSEESRSLGIASGVAHQATCPHHMSRGPCCMCVCVSV